ncbi:MAG: efflux RND transporter periplasmic adaptor subunit [Lysobacterales bacterium]
MHKKKVIPLLLVVLIVAIGFGWWYAGRQDKQDGNMLMLYGNVDIRETDLAFNNSEHVDQLLVQEGDRVKKGQLLATLHSERSQAEADAARARVEAQKAVVARLESGSRPQEIRQAHANVAAATAKLVDARATFDRTKSLSANQAISRQALDDAQARIDMARADLKVAQESLALLLEGPRAEDIEEARASLKAGEAQLALALEVLKDTELHAPADGVIRNRILEPGDMVTPQTPVFTMALVDPVWVRTYAPESELGKLVPGMSAEVSTDSYPGKAYVGWVGYISPTAEFTPKSVQTPDLRTRLVYQVKVYVCNPQDELRLGMPATVSISLDRPKPEAGHTATDCARPKND